MKIMYGPRGPEAITELRDLLHPDFILSVKLQCKKQQPPIVPLACDNIILVPLTYEDWKKNKKKFK